VRIAIGVGSSIEYTDSGISANEVKESVTRMNARRNRSSDSKNGGSSGSDSSNKSSNAVLGDIDYSLISAVEIDSYFGRSMNQLIFGNYTEEVTLLGTAAQVGAGLLNVDLPADIRDITHDLQHWEWTMKHYMQTGLDVIGLLPVIGCLKYADEAATVLKNADELGAAVKNLEEVGDVVKGTSETVAKYRDDAVEFNGMKVYGRNDLIDPNLVDDLGRTNLQRMESGIAPIGPDGKSINLHHMTQMNDGAIAEVTQSFHQQNSKVIHINPNSVPSGIDRNVFGTWKKQYWKNRVNDFK